MNKQAKTKTQRSRSFLTIIQSLWRPLHGKPRQYEKRFMRALRAVDPEQFDRIEFAPSEVQVDHGESARPCMTRKQANPATRACSS